MKLLNCRIVPVLTDNVDFTLADIELKDNRIASVRPATGSPAAGDDIDCTGMTVLPGLMDIHVHLAGEDVPNDVAHAFSLYHEHGPEMSAFLERGVTTVRDCGSTMRLGCALRDGVERGFFTGPRILSSGHIIAPEAMRPCGENGHTVIANGPDEVALAARREFAAGADFIKIYATQSMSQVRGQDPKCIYTPEEIVAAVKVAEMNNSYVAAHAHSTDAINLCLKCGVRTIEHATYMDDESVSLFKTLPGRYAVSTSAVAELYRDGDGYNDPRSVSFWTQPFILASNKRCRALKHEAYMAGVQFAVGTDLDADSFAKYPYEFMVRSGDCGMKSLDILIQATKVSAEAAMVREVGELREGYYADIIGVVGKPDEDIAALYAKPALVIKDGEVYRR